MIYGYICKNETPAFEFFVKDVKDEEGQPIITETQLANGMKVFPVWRDERKGEVMPTIVGYSRILEFGSTNAKREFINNSDYDPEIHDSDEWWPVTEQLALNWDAAHEHNAARELHDRAHEAFHVWNYLPKDTPADVKDRMKAIYQDKAGVAFIASRRLGFGNHVVPDDTIDEYHIKMANKHRELARLYSI
ncbi:hypothetical protein Milano_121 [Agrobacterium phage Milano]|nr:hypothetical protein Milano_121 [Agrobacterium phage Milano]